MRWRRGTGILPAALALITGALFLAGPPPAAALDLAPAQGRAAAPDAAPARGPERIAARDTDRPGPGRTAEERLWLLGGLGLALAATGVVAGAAVRLHREPPGSSGPGSNPHV
ncbi:hypothetical protein [Streptomyces roseoviridis]|uniref:D-alanyl-D-alanine carboxypeptidase n=1 Tax=Streptomyces roseoviridis TaxID=67361 RepID=A0ABV5QHE3_9ACTN